MKEKLQLVFDQDPEYGAYCIMFDADMLIEWQTDDVFPVDHCVAEIIDWCIKRKYLEEAVRCPETGEELSCPLYRITLKGLWFVKNFHAIKYRNRDHGFR